MTNQHIYEKLPPNEVEKIKVYESQKPFSLHWELTTMLYLGVLMLNLGLGILIYENIDTIGHAVLIGLIGLLSAGCFYYAFSKRNPFLRREVSSPTPYFDYILLLGCLTFLIMEGYWQFQYQIFGSQYGLATFIPMVLFFGLAYFFDHKGVLSLAITALAAWVGISITPMTLLQNNDFDSPRIIYTGVMLGVALIVAAYMTEKQGLKAHFSSTYHHFSVHVFMISALSGLIILRETFLFLPLIAAGAAYFIWYARQSDSLFFLTAGIVYAYIGFSYLFVNFISAEVPVLIFYYFLFSCIGVIYFLINYKKILKTTKS
jgi:hypothetical protein